MIMQHDRPFVASFPLAPVLAAMDADPALKYVGLHTGGLVCGARLKTSARVWSVVVGMQIPLEAEQLRRWRSEVWPQITRCEQRN